MPGGFIDRLLPAPVNAGFTLPDHWVWCGSAIRGDDGRYHLFASRWPRGLSFTPHWLTNSEVVRATADSPEGPYTFDEVVLPARGGDWWDGKMTHNPTIHRCGGTWLLYYTGTTYPGDMPTLEHPETAGYREGRIAIARQNQRVGLATAPSVAGPWTRRDTPLLTPRPGLFDGLMNTNPAPCVLPSGEVLLVYKAVGHHQDLLRLGLARAAQFDGPYEYVQEEPLFRFDATGDHVEDAYVWHDGSGYELLMKDMRGGICGEKGGGIHAGSPDGLHWTLSDPPLAYSKTVRWDDGSTTTQAYLERPQVLVEDGRPTHLFLATMDGPGGISQRTRSWNMVIPLRPPG